jgi:hypothetical protein
LVLEKIFKGNAFLAHFGMMCALCALDEAVVHKFEGTHPSYVAYYTCVQKIKFVDLVVFEKKRFEAKVDGNTYAYESP